MSTAAKVLSPFLFFAMTMNVFIVVHLSSWDQ